MGRACGERGGREAGRDMYSYYEAMRRYNVSYIATVRKGPGVAMQDDVLWCETVVCAQRGALGSAGDRRSGTLLLHPYSVGGNAGTDLQLCQPRPRGDARVIFSPEQLSSVCVPPGVCVLSSTFSVLFVLWGPPVELRALDSAGRYIVD